jgi:uncharacterized protein (TIGR03118 family)
VTYAVPKSPDFSDDSAGTGVGYIDIYDPNGTLDKRFASNGYLNSPWGLARGAPVEFGEFHSTILVGNVGNGIINAYDDGTWLGQVDANKAVVMIDGLGPGLQAQLRPGQALLHGRAKPREPRSVRLPENGVADTRRSLSSTSHRGQW